jgi:hypothetical protein
MCNSQKKLPVGDGDDLGPQLLGHLICLFTLIINIYGLRVGISTIKKFTSGRGWSMTPRGLSYNAFNLPSQPDHKYIWFRVGISVTLFKTDSPVGWG